MKLSRIYSAAAMFLIAAIYAPFAFFSTAKPEPIAYEADIDYNGTEGKN